MQCLQLISRQVTKRTFTTKSNCHLSMAKSRTGHIWVVWKTLSCHKWLLLKLLWNWCTTEFKQ